MWRGHVPQQWTAVGMMQHNFSTEALRKDESRRKNKKLERRIMEMDLCIDVDTSST